MFFKKYILIGMSCLFVQNATSADQVIEFDYVNRLGAWLYVDHDGDGVIEETDERINESSGIAQSHSGNNVFWTHNDGSSRWMACARRNGTYLGRIELPSTLEVDDAEDMSTGPGPVDGKNYIYYGDVGNTNDVANNPISVIRFLEPEVNGGAINGVFGSVDVKAVDILRYRYPNGEPYDCEAMIVDPRTKDIYFVTKNVSPVKIYVAYYPQPINRVPTNLIELIELPASVDVRITGADISADGSEILLRSGNKAFYWYRGSDQTVITAMMSRPPVEIPLADQRKGEAICWAKDGSGFYTSSEYGMYLDWYIRRSSPPNVLPSAQDQTVTMSEDGTTTMTLVGSDVDGTITNYTTTQPLNGTLFKNGAVVTYSPRANYFGTDSFNFTVTDNQGAVSARATVSITINSVNDAPVVANRITDKNATVGVTFNYPAPVNTFADIDGTILSWSAIGMPTGITFNPVTRRFSGAPTAAGTRTITVTASDGSVSVNTTFRIVVSVGAPPSPSKPDTPTTVVNGTSITVSGFTTAGGEMVHLFDRGIEITSFPSESDGTWNYTMTDLSVGEHVITVLYRNTGGSSEPSNPTTVSVASAASGAASASSGGGGGGGGCGLGGFSASLFLGLLAFMKFAQQLRSNE